jgi:hypothetical protein
MPDKCYAPVFSAHDFGACIILAIIYTAVIITLLVGTAFLILLSARGRCLIKQYSFRISHCGTGNSNPNLPI